MPVMLGSQLPRETSGRGDHACLEDLVFRLHAGRQHALVQTADQRFGIREDAVAEIHGVQLHTIALLKPGALPKTSSGKIRHRACAEALSGGQWAEVLRWIKPNTDSAAMLQGAAI